MASRATQLTKTRKQVQTIPNNKKQVQTILGLQKSRLTYDIASAGALTLWLCKNPGKSGKIGDLGSSELGGKE